MAVKDDKIKWPCNNKEGYVEAREGDGVVPSRPEQTRKSVMKDVSFAVTAAGSNIGVVVKEDNIKLAGKMADTNVEQAKRVYDTDGNAPSITAGGGSGSIPKIEVVGNMNIKGALRKNNEVYGENGISPCITAFCGMGGGNCPRIEVSDDNDPKVEESGRLNSGSKYQLATKVHSAEGIAPTLTTRHPGVALPKIEVVGDLNRGNYERDRRVHSPDGISPCIANTSSIDHTPKIEVVPEMEEGDVCPMLTPGRENKRQNGRRFKEPDEPAFTVTTQDQHGVAQVENSTLRIRYLTEREAWRLQGFDDARIDKAFAQEKSKTQRYKMAGNSIAVPVLEAIFKGIYVEPSYEKPKTKQTRLGGEETNTPSVLNEQSDTQGCDEMGEKETGTPVKRTETPIESILDTEGNQ